MNNNFSQFILDLDANGEAHMSIPFDGSITSNIVDTTAKEVPSSTPPVAIASTAKSSTVYTPPARAYSYSSCRQIPSYMPSPSAETRISFADILHYRKRWEHHAPENKVSRDGLKLKNGISFSPATAAFLGGNCSVSVFDNSEECIAIFAGYVEKEAYEQAKVGNNEQLKKILVLNEGELRVQYQFVNDTISWRLRYNTEYKQGFISFIQGTYNLSRLDALATLADITGLAFERMFSIYNVEHAHERNHFLQISDNTLTHFTFTYEGVVKHAIRTQVILLKGYAGNIIGAIAIYETNDGRKFALPVAAARRKLSIGTNKATALFFNQDKMDANPSATVLLCQDIYLALALDEFFKDDPSVVVIAHFGRDLTHLPWNFLTGRKVILICAPHVDLYAQVGEYEATLKKIHAKEIAIFPFPLLYQDTTGTPDCTDLPPLEVELVSKARRLSEEYSSKALKQHIAHEAMLYKDFVTWGYKLELFAKAKEYHKGSNCPIPIFSATSNSSLPSCFTEVTLDHVLPSPGVALIYAKKNYGKSNVIMGFIKALIQHQEFGGMKKTYSPRPLMLLDTESLVPHLKFRITQFGLDKNENFKCISKLASDVGSEWVSIDLSCPEHRQMVQEAAETLNTKYIFVDNLTSGVKPGSLYLEKTIGDIFTWTEKLHPKNTGFTIVHHAHNDTNKSSINAEIRGSKEFIIRSHSILILIGKDEIKNKITPSPAAVQDAAKASGATIGIYFKACKMANILEGTILWGHLPQNTSEWQWLAHTDCDGKELENSLLSTPIDADTALGIEEVIENVPEHTDITVPEADAAAQCDDGLSYEEQRVLECFDSHKAITVNEVMQALDCKSSKAQKLLKTLTSKNRIIKEGEGRATKYLLSPN